MLIAALVLIGLISGLAIGRAWALVVPVALGVWVAATIEVEVPPALVGAGYGACCAVGVVAGLWLRHLMRTASRARA